jgi:hypothetical protein
MPRKAGLRNHESREVFGQPGKRSKVEMRREGGCESINHKRKGTRVQWRTPDGAAFRGGYVPC